MSIVLLSKMTEAQRIKFMEYYENILCSGVAGFKFLKPSKDYDEFGLRFPIEYLSTLGKQIVMLPLELMAEYVDLITKAAIDDNDKEFIFHQIIDYEFDIEKQFHSLNATALGNMAYIALNCKNGKAKLIVEQQLNQIFVKMKGMFLNHLNEQL